MADSISNQLERDMACEGLLECIHGLKQLDKACYRALVESDRPLSIDEISERVERERSTAYRSLQRLHDAGFIQREQINYEDGGYYHVFYPSDPSRVVQGMQRMLNDWYVKMGQLIHEFEQRYAQTEEPTPTIEG